MVIGSAFGPLPFGFAYHLFGGYKEIIIVMILFSGLTAIATFFIFPPDRKN
jgi:cyanate permease